MILRVRFNLLLRAFKLFQQQRLKELPWIIFTPLLKVNWASISTLFILCKLYTKCLSANTPSYLDLYSSTVNFKYQAVHITSFFFVKILHSIISPVSIHIGFMMFADAHKDPLGDWQKFALRLNNPNWKNWYFTVLSFSLCKHNGCANFICQHDWATKIQIFDQIIL